MDLLLFRPQVPLSATAARNFSMKGGLVNFILGFVGMLVFTALRNKQLGWASVAKYWLGWIAGTLIFAYALRTEIGAGVYCWCFALYAFTRGW